MSWRTILLTGAAIAVVAATFAPTDASAHWRGRGGWGGGYYGGGGYGYYGGGGYGYYRGGGGYYGGGYPAYGGGGCWRRQVVYSPYGPRVRRIWVCG